MLVQYDGNDQHVVAFCARKLQSAEVNYTTTEQELLGIIFCFMQWRCYLEGPQVILHTDHEPLTWLVSQKTMGRRQSRWLEFMSRFRYTVLFIKGDLNKVADALSRRLSLPDDDAQVYMPHEQWLDAALYASRDRPSLSPDPAGPGGRQTELYSSSGNGATVLAARPIDGAAAQDKDRPGLCFDTQHPRSILQHLVAAAGHTRARSHCWRGEGTAYSGMSLVLPENAALLPALPGHAALPGVPDHAAITPALPGEHASTVVPDAGLQAALQSPKKRRRVTLSDQQGVPNPGTNSDVETSSVPTATDHPLGHSMIDEVPDQSLSSHETLYRELQVTPAITERDLPDNPAIPYGPECHRLSAHECSPLYRIRNSA